MQSAGMGRQTRHPGELCSCPTTTGSCYVLLCTAVSNAGKETKTMTIPDLAFPLANLSLLEGVASRMLEKVKEKKRHKKCNGGAFSHTYPPSWGMVWDR